MLTLYQHSARRSTVTHDYVAAVTARGAEVRTLDEFFNRIIVVDRRMAMIPAPSDLTLALAIREPTVVAYLVDVFVRSWERARPFTNRESSMLKDIAAEQRAMTMRMLIEGHADPVSAKRLGVSPRTYAGYVADLKDEYDAETRFQLGYTMGRPASPATSVDTDADHEGLTGMRTITRAVTGVTALVNRAGPGGGCGTATGGCAVLGSAVWCAGVRHLRTECSPRDICLSRCGDPEKAEAQTSGGQGDGHLACDLHAHSTFESFRDPLTGPVDRFSLVLHRCVGRSLAHKHALQFVAAPSGWAGPLRARAAAGPRRTEPARVGAAGAPGGGGGI